MRYILRITGDAGDFYGRVTAEDGSREWDVEASWTAAQARRWIAGGYPGAGPGRFTGAAEVITAAAGRFTGAIETRGWEDQVTAGQPGDQLYLSYIAGDGKPGSGQHGTAVAEIPALPPEPEPGPAAPQPQPGLSPAADPGTQPAALAGEGTLSIAAAGYGQGEVLLPGPPPAPDTAGQLPVEPPPPEPGTGGDDAR